MPNSSQSLFSIFTNSKLSLNHMAFVFLLGVLVVPFFIFKHAGPQSVFFIELPSAILLSVFCMVAFLAAQKTPVPNKVAAYLIIMAGYLLFDAYINDVIYPELSLMYVGSLLLAALASMALKTLVERHGLQELFGFVCFSLVVGSLLQDIVIILQITQQEWLSNWIYIVIGSDAYSGNIGQRNLTAHYLSWGVLATAYLLSKQKLTTPTGWSLILFQAIILGMVNSRALLMYMLVILVVLAVLCVKKQYRTKPVVKVLGIATVLVLVCQVVTLPLVNHIQQQLISSDIVNATSVSRLTQSSGIASRLAEWHKAWLIFLQQPWFGTGWGSYGYQGFAMSLDPKFASTPYEEALFFHSHSTVFNLLAEVGIVGASVIIGGLLYLLSPLLFKLWQDETIVLVAMMLVTAAHSLVEFPLWHFHFFAVFGIIFSLYYFSMLSHAEKTSKSYRKGYLRQLIKPIFMLASVMGLGVSLSLYAAYDRLSNLGFGNDQNSADIVNTANKMLNVGEQQPLIRIYTEIRAAIHLTNLETREMPQAYAPMMYRVAHYQPSSLTGAFYLAQRCEIQKDWREADWQYYRQLSHYFKRATPITSIALSTTTDCKAPYNTVYKACQVFQRARGTPEICSLAESKAMRAKLKK